MYDKARRVDSEAVGKTGIHPADVNLDTAGWASVQSSRSVPSGLLPSEQLRENKPQ